MLNWKKKKVEIKLTNGESKIVSGRSAGNFCVHKSSEPKPSTGEEWVITHAPSGRKLTARSSQKKCVDLIEELSSNVFGFIYMPVSRLRDSSDTIMRIVSQHGIQDLDE